MIEQVRTIEEIAEDNVRKWVRAKHAQVYPEHKYHIAELERVKPMKLSIVESTSTRKTDRFTRKSG